MALAASPALAQSVSLDFGDTGSLAARSVELILLVTLLSIVPGLAVMVTCFPFIVTVLSILRQALGLQQAPPNMVIVSLALFLTWFVRNAKIIKVKCWKSLKSLRRFVFICWGRKIFKTCKFINVIVFYCLRPLIKTYT